MKNRKTKIQQFLAGLSGSPIFVCIGLWTFWEPDFIKARTGIPDTLFDAGAVIYLLFDMAFFMMRGRQRQHKAMRKYHCALLAVAFIMCASTLLHSGLHLQMWKCLKYIYPIAGSVLLLEAAMFEDETNAFRAVYWMCWVQIVVNCLTVFLCPNGLYTGTDNERQFLLGNENVFIMTILPGLCAGSMLLLKKGRKISWDYAVLVLACIASVVKVWSVSSLLGMLCFFIPLAAAFIIPWDLLFTVGVGIAAAFAGFVTMVLLRLEYLFAPVIVGVFHKNLTLTRRTLLWEKLIEAIGKSPVTGYGVETAEQFSARVGGDMHWVHAHDYYLELLMKGGVLLLGAFLLLLIVTACSLDPVIARKEAKIQSATIFAFLICFIGDCYEMRTTFYMILTCAMVYGCLHGRAEERHDLCGNERADGKPDVPVRLCKNASEHESGSKREAGL